MYKVFNFATILLVLSGSAAFAAAQGGLGDQLSSKFFNERMIVDNFSLEDVFSCLRALFAKRKLNVYHDS
ncbi:hypothetical protein CVT25_003288 [Psilocybe cyanescens]|uniref:Uncharacterized protein n=1 Tax=Psilocybe cyanescens TaxID=93625 RepID=A0A409WMH3_PSICY|nr:hypothetical protein CVT25_003288 [Psilocybe cyanescens]